MNNPLPGQLRDPEYRFFLAPANQKNPYEVRWNDENNYSFFEEKLTNHIAKGGNVGICTGFGNLIVIDFDDKDFQQQLEHKLPRTFTVKTAVKQLKHFYYHLGGEMIARQGLDKVIYFGKEISLRDFQDLKRSVSMARLRELQEQHNLEISRILDIQAGRCGVTCPPSKIDSRFYSVIDETPIQSIDVSTLSEIFGLDNFKQPKQYGEFNIPQPKKIQEAINLMKELKIQQTGPRHYKCPFHKMSGKGNMHIFDDGSIFCFNCQFHANSAQHFKRIYSFDNLVI